MDLRNSAHIQTAEKFSKGEILERKKRNPESYQKLRNNYSRFSQEKGTEYEDVDYGAFREKFINGAGVDGSGIDHQLPRAGVMHKQGVETVKDAYSGKNISTQTKIGGKNNPNAAQRDHVTAAHEIYQDPSLQMTNSDVELAKTINNSDNLVYTSQEMNRRKSDKKIKEMDDDDKTDAMKEADKKSRESLKKKRKEGEDRLVKEGRETQKDEAKRMAASASKAIGIQFLMTLLKDFLKEVTFKLIAWFKSGKKKIETFLSAMKDAIHDFVTKLRKEIGKHVKNALETGVKLLVGAIFKPMARIIRRFGAMITQRCLSG